MPSASSVETVIVPRSTDLGGFEVKRVLPSSRRRMVGPFIFLDQMGPTDFEDGTGVDVRPHPHIGLSTVTWLLAGEIMHRDSVGSVQNIRPGEVNWMTAGSGIAHSERTPDALRPGGSALYGLQTWLALPQPYEEAEPFFEHFGAEALPALDGDGLTATLIAGTGWGKRSPVQVFSETVYADVQIAGGSALPIPPEHEERAVYVLEGSVSVDGEDYEAGSLMVFRPGDAIDVRAAADARVMVLGGEAADGPRHIWWNFVSSRPDRIEQAKRDWEEKKFAEVVDDDEFIPLPKD